MYHPFKKSSSYLRDALYMKQRAMRKILEYSAYFIMLKNLITKHFSYTKGLAIKYIEMMETDI